MIAFDLGFIKIYWYGIFYAVSFVIGYYLVRYFAKWIYIKYSKSGNIYNLYKTIYDEFDDIILYICAGVIIGGRMGEVLIYNLSYYMADPIKILALQDGGMSFIGGFVGVMLAVFIYRYRKNWSFDEVLCLFDLIVLVLPIGIMLGRLGNYLNQELVGQTITNIYNKYNLTSIFGDIGGFETICSKINLCHIYTRVDNQLRLNNNLLEGLGEGFVTGIIGIYIWLRSYRYNIRPGLITGVFMIIYGIARIIMENFRDNPPSEYIYGLLKSQLWMIGFLLFGIWLIFRDKIIK